MIKTTKKEDDKDLEVELKRIKSMQKLGICPGLKL
jgi:hypothetical protein